MTVTETETEIETETETEGEDTGTEDHLPSPPAVTETEIGTEGDGVTDRMGVLSAQGGMFLWIYLSFNLHQIYIFVFGNLCLHCFSPI